jgi:hypothetical protein
MADPRNTIDWEGLGKEAEPFIIDASTITYDATQVLGSAQVGLAVTLSAAKTVALTADGDAVRATASAPCRPRAGANCPVAPGQP